MQLDVSLDVRQLERALGRLARDVVPRATASTLNKTVQRVQTRVLRLLSDDIGFTKVYGRREGVRRVRKYLRIKRATWRNLAASIEASGKRIPVHMLNAKQTPRGVEYQGQDGKRKLIPGAFLAEIRVQGVAGAYKRKGKARFPVQFLRTVSVPHVFIQQRTEQAMQEVANEAWGKNWPHEVRRAMSKAGF